MAIKLICPFQFLPYPLPSMANIELCIDEEKKVNEMILNKLGLTLWK